MPDPKLLSIHKAGVRVLKAISASIRIQILNLMLEHGPMSYTEIMNALKLDATRDAGRFAYHLKSLLKADLIEPDVESKKYRLTDLGRRIIEITDEIEDRTYKRRRMLVRTSHFSIEEFDRNKIAQSLIIEANVPTDLAQKIARETEKRLQQFKTKYLTAPLIREIVNTILLEKHYEDYRHKLTRLGLPVHEVTRLIDAPKPNVEAVRKAAGNSVIEEYTLLNVLPRNISDAHLSGSIHLHNLGTWILKPNEITHSLPYFLQAYKPQTLEAALNIATNIVRNTAAEIAGQQNLDNFNVHLASYAKDIAPDKIKELLHLFIKNLNQTASTPTTISLELSAEKSTPYTKEAQQLAHLLLETLTEENTKHPLQNPKIIIKTRQETFQTTETESLLYEAHKLATASILTYFANLCPDSQKNATYTTSGLRLADEWQQDWELDTQRTGNLDIITMNLPRISFDAKGDEDRFLELLGERLDMVNKALEIKYQTIEKRAEQKLLPYLTQKADGGQYFRLENTTRTIVSAGLNEAVQTLMGKEIREDYGKAFVLTERILKQINTYTKKHTKKPQNRLTTAIIPNTTAAKRLARLDVEKYGWGVVKTQGTREHPYYSDINRFSLLENESLSLEEQIHQLTSGGHIALIETADQLSPEELLAKTKQLITSNIGFFAYNTPLTFCHTCKALSHGTHLKCPHCSSTNILSLTHF